MWSSPVNNDAVSQASARLPRAQATTSPSHAARRQFEQEIGASIPGLRCGWDGEHEPIVPGRRGYLYVYGPGRLGVHAHGRRGLLNRLIAVLGRPLQHGDNEAAWVLPAARLDEAVDAIRAYRRRSLSPKRQAEFVARGRGHQFQSGHGAHEPLAALKRTIGTQRGVRP